MNKQFLALLSFAMLVPPMLAGCLESNGDAEIEELTWMTYSSGLSEGIKHEKPILVDLYAEWCGPCKQMDAITYQDPSVIGMIQEEFIAVKVDTDLEPSLAYQYSVQYIPTIVYLKPNGDEVHRTVGYRSVSQILVDMQTALQNM
jgi:thiol:disulfide interchange protein DsbD